MDHADAGAWDPLFHLNGDVVNGFDVVVNVENLPTARQLLLDELIGDALLKRGDVGLDRHSRRRSRIDFRDWADPHQRHLQGARDRSCGKGEDINVFFELLDLLFLLHAEPLLLIDDQKPKVFVANRFGKKPMGADDEIDFPVRDVFDRFPLHIRRNEARKQSDPHPKGGETPLGDFEMLPGQKGGRNQHRDLLPRVDRFESGPESDFGFPEPDIPADEAIHDIGVFHIGLDVVDGLLLVGGQFIRELPFELFLEFIVFGEREPTKLGAGSV